MICKLGVINERPEFGVGAGWSETGDRYLLKLFRDHLFHQVTDTGSPWIDMSHIVQSLNKVNDFLRSVFFIQSWKTAVARETCVQTHLPAVLFYQVLRGNFFLIVFFFKVPPTRKQCEQCVITSDESRFFARLFFFQNIA